MCVTIVILILQLLFVYEIISNMICPFWITVNEGNDNQTNIKSVDFLKNRTENSSNT